MNPKEIIQKVIDECTKIYEKHGSTAVHDHVILQQELHNPMYENVTYKQCTACNAGQPNIDDTCLICGSSTKILGLGDILNTVGELRKLMSNLNDKDFIVVEACDENGDVEDLYPMSLDVIDGIELTDGSMVNEVRFCQRPNSEPDDRDKQPIIDAILRQERVDAFYGVETTTMSDLLKLIPYELLINALPKAKGLELREEIK